MNEEELLWLWGKTVKDKDGKQRPEIYHPLLFHLLDVGHIARLLWKGVLPRRTRRRIAKALKLNDDEAEKLVVWLAASHDIGKACPRFQFQNEDPKFGPQFLWDRLKSAGLLPGSSTENVLHSFVSTKTLEPYLGDTAGRVLRHITGAHHGTFPTSPDLVDMGKKATGDASWEAAREALLRAMNAALFNDADYHPKCGEINDPAIVPILAGLISVADWIGSAKEYFPAVAREHQPVTIATYNSDLEERAEAALKKLGWLPNWEPATSRPSFRQLFRFDRINALQREAVKQSENIDGPFLMIAEVPMGGGKTEAALWCADVALCRQVANGFYLALPTQATSNAMHSRLRDEYFRWREHKLNVDLMLAHGNALLHDEREFRTGPIYGEQAKNGDHDNRAAAESWFSGRKRPLLAPFGVGTIDQSLLGALQTSHWFVRLFGLAGKVVIFDEVHAYDTYMSTLLERLLQWLRVLDCSVILLSATLPQTKRHNLLQAWNENISIPEEAEYPRLTWLSENATEPDSIPLADETPPKDVAIDVKPTDDRQLALLLREKLKGGGCAVIICNTVNRAQEVYGVLREQLNDLVPLEEFHLLHARMPFAWRKRREETILAKFGKVKAHRPHRAVVIGTSVLEQSLDLDFDWMASEMAPIDLLLQRLGRLHRHEKDEDGQAVVRPEVLCTPEFVILCDAKRDGTPPESFGNYESHGNIQSVYERFILLRSWLALKDNDLIRIPNDIEPLINEVYDDELPKNSNGEWQLALQVAKEDFDHRKDRDKHQAGNVVVSEPEEPEILVDQFSADLKDDDDPQVRETLRAATRSGKPSISVVCLCQTAQGVFLPDENGAPDITKPVDLSEDPKLPLARDLLQSSLPISHGTLYHALRDDPRFAPVGWRKNPHLRFHRALIFQDGSTLLAGYVLRLDPKLGLVIEKEKEESG